MQVHDSRDSKITNKHSCARRQATQAHGCSVFTCQGQHV